MAPKILVLDDDPTGSQTVHGCWLLTRWDEATLCQGLRDASPLLFVLTNTRALPPAQAAQRTHEVCAQLRTALAVTGIDQYAIVSRSDSTLRGHYPLETDAIAAEMGPFDAHFLVPAFLEGGRFTRDSVHYLMVNGQPVPTHETEFAKDSVFGYRHSYLPDYVAEKTQGQIPANQVERFLLADIRAGVGDRLLGLTGNRCVVVDAETQSDLDRFAQEVLVAAAQGKRFLFRSAASLLTSLAQLPPQPVPPAAMGQFTRAIAPVGKEQRKQGAILVGSHVRKTTEQLMALRQRPTVAPIELDLQRLQAGAAESELLTEVQTHIQTAWSQGLTPVVFTSREERTFADAATRLAFGQRVSALLMAIARSLPADLGFLIGKGGITSNDLLSDGLAVPMVRLQGQILPGCSLVVLPADHPQFPHLPVVLFPGNVGDAQALTTVYDRLSQPQGLA
ncbi:MAG: four-carbon acid sugar kinase family protein [Pseudanabaenaceae cyanobacterium]